MDGEHEEHDASAMPTIPVFFSSDDLPAWLRPDAETPVPAPPARETRARAAWAPLAAAPAPSETPFRAAADATWDLLTPPPRHAKRGRRAGGAS